MTVLQELEKMADRMPQPAIRHSILQAAHVLRYPMRDILAKIPGDTLKDRAEAIGVSRQTMYVWMHERFRPGADQAAIISKLTGTPVWQIRDLQEGDDGDDVGTASPKAGGRVAKDGAGVPARQRGTPVRNKGGSRSQPGVGRRARQVR